LKSKIISQRFEHFFFWFLVAAATTANVVIIIYFAAAAAAAAAAAVISILFLFKFRNSSRFNRFCIVLRFTIRISIGCQL
jgi:hypothetical protein